MCRLSCPESFPKAGEVAIFIFTNLTTAPGAVNAWVWMFFGLLTRPLDGFGFLWDVRSGISFTQWEPKHWISFARRLGLLWPHGHASMKRDSCPTITEHANA